MNAAYDRIKEIRNELYEINRKEAHNLFRLARRAHEHGADKVANELQDEAWLLYTTCEAYPERLVAYELQYKTKHAFRY